MTTRQSIVCGPAGPVYVCETGTRQSIVSGIYVCETISVAAAFSAFLMMLII